MEEDLGHEFKGHRHFASEEISHDAIKYRSRKAISRCVIIKICVPIILHLLISCRNLCGFLNSGMGGIVYCGVTDEGTVEGIGLNEYQKDHILLAVQDTLLRFEPSVSPDMYSVSFIPVLTSMDQDQDITFQPVDPEQRLKTHLFRTSKYCWCEKYASAQHGMVPKVIPAHNFLTLVNF